MKFVRYETGEKIAREQGLGPLEDFRRSGQKKEVWEGVTFEAALGVGRRPVQILRGEREKIKRYLNSRRKARRISNP